MRIKKFVAMLLGVMMVFSTATVSANSTDKELLPSNVPFCDVINYAADIEDVNEIKHGVIVNNTDKKCADIEYDDLKNGLMCTIILITTIGLWLRWARLMFPGTM